MKTSKLTASFCPKTSKKKYRNQQSPGRFLPRFYKAERKFRPCKNAEAFGNYNTACKKQRRNTMKTTKKNVKARFENLIYIVAITAASVIFHLFCFEQIINGNF